MSVTQEVPILCVICHKPVAIETANTNSRGEPVHEDCYVARVVDDVTPSPE